MARRTVRNGSNAETPRSDRSMQVGASDAGTGPSRERIAARAYQIFLARGRAHGRHEEDWRKAEEELRAESLQARS